VVLDVIVRFIVGVTRIPTAATPTVARNPRRVVLI